VEISPLTKALVTATTRHIQEMFNIEKLTVKSNTYAPNIWSLTVFHGKAKKQSVATYEADGPSSLRYTPRQRFHIVVDGPNNFLYLAAQQVDRERLLSTLNEIVFPENKCLASVKFDLDILSALNDEVRHPMNGILPWHHLGLQFVKNTSNSYGEDPQLNYFSKEDGFEKLENDSYRWPSHVEEVRIQCKIPERKHPFKVGLFHKTGLINATLTLQTLNAIAGIVNLCREEGEVIPQSYTVAQQLQLSFL
jgi:hypothetical protein